LGRRQALLLAAGSTGHAVLGLGRWLTVAAGPVALVTAVRRPRLAAALAAPLLQDYLRRRPGLDPVRFAAAGLADDLAYGTGVWRGVLEHRDPRALLPRIR
ncbi:MAG: mycofactocin biosynthesis glycosyltransferase MftF, partial [Mycobacteriales bacterium]